MTTVIRPANLETDREILIEAIHRWVSPQADARRYDWLYRNCPHGPAHVWIATQGEGGSLIGAAAAFPRRMYLDGVRKLGCVLGDFFVVPEYRSLGPAVQLQRACLAIVDSKTFYFCYDFPAPAMLPVYKRLSLEPVNKLVRMAKPLRADRKIREWVDVPIVARGLTAAANRLIKMKNQASADSRICEVLLHEGACGEEFTTLTHSFAGLYGVCVERSAEYLNWRFKNHFAKNYEFLIARREAKLLAYVVYSHDGEDAEIADLFGSDEPQVVAELINAAASRLHQQGAITLSTHVLASHPWVGVFEKLGFYMRESCPVLAYCAARPNVNNTAASKPWFLMQGDRES